MGKETNEIENLARQTLGIIAMITRLRGKEKTRGLKNLQDTALSALAGDTLAQASLVAQHKDDEIIAELANFSAAVIHGGMTPDDGIREAEKTLGRKLSEDERNFVLGRDNENNQ